MQTLRRPMTCFARTATCNKLNLLQLRELQIKHQQLQQLLQQKDAELQALQ